MAATNRGFNMQSIHEAGEHPYDHIDLFRVNSTASPATNQAYPADENRRQPTENVGIGRRMLFAVIAVLTLSSLATVATLIVTITVMKSENAPASIASTAATRGDQGKCVFPEVKQKLTELKEEMMEEMRALKENLTSGRVFERVYKNCAHVYHSGNKISGVYEIDPDGLGVFKAYCDQNTAGGGWTMVQKRHDGSVDFYNGWDAYKRGFGYLNGEFWLGLDKVHRLTENGNNKLRVDLELHNEAAFAEYNFFSVENETEKYKLYVGGYSGTVGDSLTYHRYQAFTTKDRDNDALLLENCAVKDLGAWWYKDCYQSNLNAMYLNGSISGQGMIWFSWKNDYISVTRSEMKIRPKEF